MLDYKRREGEFKSVAAKNEPRAGSSFSARVARGAARALNGEVADKIVITGLILSKLRKHCTFAIDHFSATFIMEIDLELRIARFPPLTHPAT